ncbi:MAG: GTPase HflX [Candidatus Hodarchaeales archaeon]|jgi:GTP-binding protein HflX
MDRSKKSCFTAILKIPSTNDLENEFLALVDTCGYYSVHHFVQKSSAPRSAYFFGQGKIDEIGVFISNWIEQNGHVERIIFGNQLTPTQLVNIETKINSEYLNEQGFEIEVMDKFGLVLEIFRQNASSEEAQLQVELATKEYLLPFQKKRLVAKMGSTRKGEASAGGTYAGTGMSPLEIQEMDFKRTKTTIKKKLSKLVQQREDRREKYRKKAEFVTVSILGYTSAGKSSLLNAITSADVKVDASLFTTLTTKTSGVKLDDLTVLVSDTVGFIEDLPPHLFDAFKSTLEEATDTDITFCIVDANEDQETMMRKLSFTFEVLNDLGPKENTGILLTKIDLLANSIEIDEKIAAIKSKFPDSQVEPVSALTNDMKGFWTIISMYFPRYEYKLHIPIELEKLKYPLYDVTRVLKETYDDQRKVISLEIATRRPEWFKTKLASIERKSGTKLLVE